MLDVVGFMSHFLLGFLYCCAIVRVGSVEEEEGRGDGKRAIGSYAGHEKFFYEK